VTSAEDRRSGRILVLVAIVTLALTLRPVVNALGVVMPELRADTGLSGTAAGLLLALPTLSFAVLGIMTPSLAARIGSHRTVVLALVALVAGQLIRSLLPGPLALFGGSVLGLAGIAGANVLLPGLVRLHFPRAIGPVTALYTTLLALGAAAASGLTLPLQHAFGGDWRLGIGMWTTLALLALAPWVALANGRPRPTPATSGQRLSVRRVLGTRVAWAMIFYFGLQALQAYVLFGWLPELLVDAGISDTAAAAQVALMAVISVPIAAVAPALVAGVRNPRWIVLLFSAGYLGGYLGLLIAPATATWVWSVLIGLGQGAFPIALTLIALRARTGPGTFALSAVTQSGGYLLASIGPIAFGVLHDLSGGWTVPLLMLCVVLAAHVVAGLAAAKPRYVEDELPPPDG